MQVICTLLQTNNHANTSSLAFLQARCSSCHPTNSVVVIYFYPHNAMLAQVVVVI